MSFGFDQRLFYSHGFRMKLSQHEGFIKNSDEGNRLLAKTNL